jgi:hypothetical protein
LQEAAYPLAGNRAVFHRNKFPAPPPLEGRFPGYRVPAQANAVPVGIGRGRRGRDFGQSAEPSDAGKGVFEDGLFLGKLGFVVYMLKGTAAATAVKRAGRDNTAGGRFLDGDKFSFGPVLVEGLYPDKGKVSGGGKVDENRKPP